MGGNVPETFAWTHFRLAQWGRGVAPASSRRRTGDADKHPIIHRAPTTPRIILSKCQQCKVEKPCIRLRSLKTALLSTLSPTPKHRRWLSAHMYKYRRAKPSPFSASLPKSLLRHQQALSTLSTLHWTDCFLYLYLTDPPSELLMSLTFRSNLFSLISVISLYRNLHMHGIAFAFLRRD